MFPQISSEIRKVLSEFPKEDQIVFNNIVLPIDKNNFQLIPPTFSSKTLAFVDGGQAEILSAGNFCLSFIRVFAQIFQDNKKISFEKQEFYLFTRARWIKEDIFYESKIFPVLGDKSIEEADLLISSNDASIKTGTERAPIGKIANMARRFAELSLGSKIKADYILLDGNLQKTFKNEDKYLSLLSEKVSALAKTSSLFTISGNSPVVLLNKISPTDCWSYFLENQTYFVKLHEKAKHVFRFDGNPEILSLLINNSQDALFLGYPYGLILADQFARVSNEEKNALRMNFLLKAENKEILEYLSSSNAHEILDNLV